MQRRILSADSHVWEPPELWPERIDPRYRGREPRLERGPDGDRFVCEGVEISPLGATQRRESPGGSSSADPEGPAAARFEDVVPLGAYDPHARMADMQLDGLWGEVLYPTVTLELFGIPDAGLRSAAFRAYNDWVADYCRPYPDRLKAVGVVDTEDPGAAVRELERVRSMGLVGALISVAPGDDRYLRPEFDRFWSAAEALELPVSLHSGTEQAPVPFTDKSIGMLVSISVPVQVTLVDLVYAGVFARHPALRVVSVENGAGWAPYMMQAMDVRVFLDASRKLRFGDEEPLRPSEYVRRNVRITFMSDKLAIRLRDVIGVEALLWASDYPHPESTFPASRAVIERQLKEVPAGEQEQLICGNTARLYGFG